MTLLTNERDQLREGAGQLIKSGTSNSWACPSASVFGKVASGQSLSVSLTRVLMLCASVGVALSELRSPVC